MPLQHSASFEEGQKDLDSGQLGLPGSDRDTCLPFYTRHKYCRNSHLDGSQLGQQPLAKQHSCHKPHQRSDQNRRASGTSVAATWERDFNAQTGVPCLRSPKHVQSRSPGWQPAVIADSGLTGRG